MTDGAPANKWFCNLIHLNRRLHSGIDSLLFQRILQRQGIDHGGQHAHVIGGNPVHLFGLFSHAPEEIASAHHDSDLDAQRSNVRQFRGDFVNAKRIDTETLGRGQSLAGKLKQNAFKNRSCHDFVAPASRRLSWGRPAHTGSKKRGTIGAPKTIQPFVPA